MRPFREILSHFSLHAQHTHEAAVSAVYELGRNDARAEFQAGLGAAPAPATPVAATPEGKPNEEKTEQVDAEAEETEAGEADGKPT